jgi:ribonucleoside-diphosphate reductase alpha chain
MSVGAWVYDNFDQIGGVSFLPAVEHSYKQAPYQACTKEEYEEAVNNMPKNIPWEMMTIYETEDGTTGSQELSCVAGACEIVDIGEMSAVN